MSSSARDEARNAVGEPGGQATDQDRLYGSASGSEARKDALHSPEHGQGNQRDDGGGQQGRETDNGHR